MGVISLRRAMPPPPEAPKLPDRNPWRAEFWNLTEQAAFLKKYGFELADRWAREAGTTVGGLKPGSSTRKVVIPGPRGPAGHDAAATDIEPYYVDASGSLEINRRLSKHWVILLLGDVALSAVGWPDYGVLGNVTLEVRNTSGYNITSWPDNTLWPNGTAPTVSPETDIYVLFTHDSGATIYGSIAGQNYM